jgi:mRNA interferase MazF
MSMSSYLPGDVVLVSIAIDARGGHKVRPVVILRSDSNGTLEICPVSSQPPSDSPSASLSIDDFSQGGLDLFSESYVMTGRILTVRNVDVIGKRGRLLPEYLREIMDKTARGPRGR